MTRMSTPRSRRWVAKPCRKVCTLTFLLNPAALVADRQAECSTCTSIGLSPRPGNSQEVGRAGRRQVRKMPGRCGESMPVRSLASLPWRI
jgi:hypothetical protein